ncbi:TIGR04222 domain-containing membrane protein [Streptomyces litchfieldiae]|uniref:TIGR04222 domain-containing membrane protein n=1 Tax=Streptomyces litchfieldiae TaxID=3075543 RepID=A0ABU2MR94_9ACTN|nr:TIGR04222 domain-containing membrane protein [Streptomyces sp. DSM 44938]MDT0344151.1 TIGR04222 domain-containing membrane protein [Streptomyces sp. DSM 44938]
MTPALILAVLECAALAAALTNLLVRRARATSATPFPPRGPSRVPELYEAAFLSGGAYRVADTVLCAMLAKQRIAIWNGTVTVVAPVADDEPERELLALCEDWQAPLGRVRAGLARSGPVQEIGDKLAARGLLLRPGIYEPWRRAVLTSRFTGVTVFGAGVLTLIVSPSPAVMVPLGGAVALIVISAALMPPAGRLTVTGRRKLLHLRGHDPLTPEGAAMLVALGGYVALNDLVLREQFEEAAAAPGTAAEANSPAVLWGADCGDSGSVTSCGGDSGGGGGDGGAGGGGDSGGGGGDGGGGGGCGGCGGCG